MEKVLITLCGRAGSKGFRNKNLKMFDGLPLSHYSLAAAEGFIRQNPDIKVDICLNTDSPDLADEMYDRPALHDPRGAWQMIFGVDTIPAYRRRGCAAMLLEHVIAEAKAEGRRGVVLTCKDRLVHYYAKFGFADEGVSASTHGDVVWHQMRLTF